MVGICDGRVVIVTGAGGGIGREHALLFAADVETFLYSRMFWLKMALLGLLLCNGALLLRGERRVQRDEPRAWTRLHYTAATSLVLWFLTTLIGAALPNIG